MDIKIGNQAIRIESAATKPLFRAAWKSRRCLIPASGYYEWRSLEVTGKWKDGMLSCTILTCEACDAVQDLHTRMPVILAEEGFEPWLAGESPTVDSSLDGTVNVTPVSPKMNSPKYNEPDCIEPLSEAVPSQ